MDVDDLVTLCAGIRWYRVQVLYQPLTDYLRFELCGYLANQARRTPERLTGS